jgi:hypothetical protein
LNQESSTLLKIETIQSDLESRTSEGIKSHDGWSPKGGKNKQSKLLLEEPSPKIFAKATLENNKKEPKKIQERREKVKQFRRRSKNILNVDPEDES